MARFPKDYIPRLRLHRRSGAAVVTLNYHDHQLGKFGTPEAEAAYHTLVGRWLAGGRQPLSPIEGAATVAAPFTVSRLCDQFEAHAKTYYRHADGSPTTEVRAFEYALRPLRHAFGSVPADRFGPLSLKEVRRRMIAKGWVRKRVNREVKRIKQAFRWAVSEELIPPNVAAALETVKALLRGRSEATEKSKICQVDLVIVEKIKALCPPTIQAIIDLQLLTAARPGELLGLRSVDIDRTAVVWVATLQHHKTSHHGHERRLLFGPRAQVILAPFIASRPADAPLFSPRQGNAESKAAGAVKGRRRRPGQKPATPRTTRRMGEAYSIDSYRRAIARAADAADAAERERRRQAGETVADDRRLVPRFHPHQLRHTAATELNKRFGVQAAQVILGHATLTATQIYAEADVAAAAKIAGEVG